MLLEGNNSSYFIWFKEEAKQSPQGELTHGNLIRNPGKWQGLELRLGSSGVIFIY